METEVESLGKMRNRFVAGVHMTGRPHSRRQS